MRAAAGVVVMGTGGRLVYCGTVRTPTGGCALSAAFDEPGVLRLADWSANPAEAVLEVMADQSLQVTRRLDALIVANARRGKELQADKGAGAHIPVFAPPPMPRAGFCAEFSYLCRRHLCAIRRAPAVVTLNAVLTVFVSVLVGGAFWQMDRSSFDSVLHRIGLLFFLALFFLLTALVSLGIWQNERLIYFQEHHAGAYGAAPYLLSKTICDLLPMRVLPSLLCAAIVYPMAGLRALDEDGPAAAALFAAALTLSNLAASTTFNAIGIGCRTTASATLMAAAFALLSLLLCGFLLSRRQLEEISRRAGWSHGTAGPGGEAVAGGEALGYLVFFSYLYPAFELLMSNELLGQTTIIRPILIDGDSFAVAGAEVMAHFGYETGSCERLLGAGSQGGCSYTLYALGAWVAGAALLGFVLLKFCLRDPH